MKRIGLRAVLLAVSIALPAVASATNGYFTHGYGTESKGMAGAGSALALDALGAATNPAAIAFIGARNDVGLAMFNPNRDYTVVGAPSGAPGTFGLAPGKVTSQSPLFPIPSVAMSRPFGTRQAVALLLYANGGMNTDYHATTFGSTPTGVDLQQLFIAPTYARRVTARHALGATAVLAYQRFAAKGLAAFSAFSSDPTDLSNRGYASSTGAGVRVGYQGEWTRWLSVGASYQSPVWMTRLRQYAGLFCDHGSFNIPSNWTAGVAVKPHPRVDVAADIQRTNYSEVYAVGHPMLPNLALEPLGQEGSAGFGWKDITTYKLGAQVRTGQAWTWRGGYSFGDQPVPASEVLFNILAPGVIERHVTLGLTRQFAGDRAVSAAVMRALSNTVSGPNALEAPGQQRIDLRMDEWEFEVGYTWAIR
jgi:long-chain fatty acid transport protein